MISKEALFADVSAIKSEFCDNVFECSECSANFHIENVGNVCMFEVMKRRLKS